VTVSETVVVWLSVPLVPVTVMVKVFTGVPVEVTMVRVEDVPVAGLGLNVAVVPEGTPAAFKVTPPVNPPVRVMLIVYVVLPPAGTDCEAGVADSEKSPATAAVTTSVTEAV
jgi:hypothetical protein